MSFNWLEYLDLADSLEKDPAVPGPREASLRSAISRAYYAIYGSALRFAKKEPRAPQLFGDGRDHRELINYFQGSTDSGRQKVGGKLDRLYANRIKADYSDSISGLPSLAATSMLEAHFIVTTLKKLQRTHLSP